MQYFHVEMVESRGTDVNVESMARSSHLLAQPYPSQCIYCTRLYKIYLERNMSVPKVDSALKPRFNFILLIDLIVFACILVVAGRPDGVAITVSAVIVSVLALTYRCALGIKSYVAKSAAKAKAARPNTERQFSQRVQSMPVSAVALAAKSKSKSWLRDSD